MGFNHTEKNSMSLCVWDKRHQKQRGRLEVCCCFFLMVCVCANPDCAIFRLNEGNDEILITRYRHHPKQRLAQSSAAPQSTRLQPLAFTTRLQCIPLSVLPLHQHEESCCGATTYEQPCIIEKIIQCQQKCARAHTNSTMCTLMNTDV